MNKLTLRNEEEEESLFAGGVLVLVFGGEINCVTKMHVGNYRLYEEF